MELLDQLNLDKALEANNKSIVRWRFAGRMLAWLVFAICTATLVYAEQMHLAFYGITLATVAFPLLSNFISSKTETQIQIIALLDAFIFGLLAVLVSPDLVSIVLLYLLIITSLQLLQRPIVILAGIALAILGSALCIKLNEILAINHINEFPKYIIAVGLAIWMVFTTLIANIQAKALTEFRDMAAEKNKMYQELSKKLAKYLAPQVWKNIFSGKKAVRLETQRKKLVIFFSDIRDFTELSEIMEPEALTEMLNTYLTDMSEIVLKHGGTIDKFVGDAIMVFFGDPETKGTKRDAEACVSMAIEMRKHMRTLQSRWRKLGVERPLEVRMGINTGYCTVGNFGAEQRMDYTIIGKEVNLASRLESAAEPGEIFISHETFSLVKDRILCRPFEPIIAKGFSRPVPVYKVINYRHEMGSNKSFSQMETTGFSIHMDLNEINSMDKDRILDALEVARNTVVDRLV